MAFEIEVGQTVGHMTCLKAVDRKRWINRGQESTEEQGGVGEPDRWLTLKCSCGKEFEIWDSKTPPKEKQWETYDCGCGAGKPQPVAEKKVVVRGRPYMVLKHKRLIQNFSLSAEAIVKVGDLAQREQTSLSAACERMIMAYQEDDDEQ